MRYGKRKCFDLEILKAFKIADDSTIVWDLECGQPAETAHTSFFWWGYLSLLLRTVSSPFAKHIPINEF